MKIAIPKERTPGEDRVAATPDSVKRLAALGAAVSLEAGAGAGSSISDQAYVGAGATIVADVAVLTVHPRASSLPERRPERL